MNRIVWRVLASALVLCAAGCGSDTGTSPAANRHTEEAAGPLSIRLVRAADEGALDRFEVHGLEPDELESCRSRQMDQDVWQKLFPVSLTPEDGAEYPPMLGAYAIEEDRLVFTPQYPLAAGVNYRAVFRPSELSGAADGADEVSGQFTIPAAPSAPVARVTHVFPTTGTLPENQLKFYIHFSAPMSQGEAYRRIHLLDGDGNEVADPFLELAEELWDREGMRFTLLIDPGRIKRGLKPREEVGPALEQGKSYTLLVDADWLDAEGRPLTEPHRKPFQVAAPDETLPDPARWQISVPPADSTDPLEVAFAEPLDRGMLERVLRVVAAEKARLAGTIAVDRQETRWRFVPQSPWRPGDYALVIDSALEDRAGNSIARPFETIIDDDSKKSQPAPASVSRQFSIPPAAAQR